MRTPVVVEKDGKQERRMKTSLYAATKLVTWISPLGYKTKNYWTHMKENSTVIVCHQDPFLIEDTLKETARIFADAVLGKNMEERFANMGLGRYYFGNTTPYERGSAAVGDWGQKIASMVAFPGLDLFLKPDRFPEVEAQTSSLPTFQQNYRHMVGMRLAKAPIEPPLQPAAQEEKAENKS